MARSIVLGSLLVAAVLGAAPAAALGATQTAHAGIVSASLGFQGKLPRLSHEELTISRSGKVVYRRPVQSRFCQSQPLCSPLFTSGARSSVHVLDLEHDGRPDVVLDLYTGGAHCCTVEQIFSFEPGAQTYLKTERNFYDPGDVIADLDHNGRYEFVTADYLFAHEFTDFADSGMPIEILTFHDRGFADVTGRYRKLVAADATGWLSAFRRNLGNGLGFIAAWAADEDRLGHQGLVSSYLKNQLEAGHLRSPIAVFPSGQRYIDTLDKFLRVHAYLK